jgi:uncharacterized protein
MNLDPFLREILVCPCEHHAPLDEVAPDSTGDAGEPAGVHEAADGALRCTRCLTMFPVRDGIPIMLLDEATPGPAGIGRVPGDQPADQPADHPG